ncbi:MAG: DUF669 domain-containing protein [Oscillospiraceae bacterium]
MAENITGTELGWDDAIEKDGPDYITLPAGDYDFTITNFERGRYSPKEGAKLPPCNMATLFVELDGGLIGKCTIKHNLFLHTNTEGLLCEFFTSIGQRRHGERVTMNWNAVVGSRGRCKVTIRTYKNKSGEDVQINEIKKFYEPDPNKPSAPAYQTGIF